MPSRKTERARQMQMRRAFGFVVMSAVLPGSVQWFTGNRGIGRLAGRVYGAFVAFVVVVGLGLLLFRGPTVGLLLNPGVAGVLRVLMWVLFLGWAALLLDAWRLAAPLKLGQKTRLGLTATTLALALGMGGITSVAASGFQAAGNVGIVLQGGGDVEEKAGRYNVLLLGVDGADDRDGLRPDSINVASVNAETGRAVLFGLPRNLQKVKFPLSSPLRALYRDGYVCGNNECLLNGVYTLGVEHADLYDDGVDAGLQAMKEAVSETLGLELNYYAMIDMAGFQSLINAMGGIRLNVGKPIPMGGGGSKIHGYIEPGDNVLLDGYHALWFARSRAESSDYERMVRQKCVMSAMANQLDPVTVATKFVDLSKAGQDLLSTDVGTGEVMDLAQLALQAKDLKIASVNFSPPLITPANPDFALIRSTVQAKIEESEALDEAAPAPAPETAKAAEPAVEKSPAAEEPPAEKAAPEQKAPARAPETSAAPSPSAAAQTLTPAEEAELVCSVP